jgi:hypothetical protein
VWCCAAFFSALNQDNAMNTKSKKSNPITSNLVAENNRLSFLPLCFGKRFMRTGESLVYSWLGTLCQEYSGAYWHYYLLSNGGFYMAPSFSEKLHVVVAGNGFSGELSANAAGIVATLFALGTLSSQCVQDVACDMLMDHYWALRRFVREHAEAASILAAID